VAGAISVLVAGARTDVNQRVARHLAEHERGCASATLAATRLKDIAMGRGSLIAAGFVVSEAGDEPATADAIVAREARGTDMIVWVLGSDPAEIAFAGAALLAVAEALQELVRIYPAASAAPAAIPGLESGSIEIGPVWQAVLDQAPVALRVQALRRLAALKQGDGWFASARQAIGAGGRMAQWLAGRWPSGKQS
jgi:hypothetical protein